MARWVFKMAFDVLRCNVVNPSFTASFAIPVLLAIAFALLAARLAPH